MSSRQQRMLYDVHILPFFKRQLTTFILSWNPIFLISSFVTLDGKKDGTNLWNITQTEWWKLFSLRCSRKDQKHNFKNTALMVSVIDTKAAAHRFVMWLCAHTQQPRVKNSDPHKKIAFFPLILYTNFFTVQRQTLLRSPSLFVSCTFFKCNFVSSRTH